VIKERKKGVVVYSELWKQISITYYALRPEVYASYPPPPLPFIRTSVPLRKGAQRAYLVMNELWLIEMPASKLSMFSFSV